MSGENVVDESEMKLSEFNYERTLCSSTRRKFICVEGNFPNREGIAISFFERTPLSFSNVKDMCVCDTTLERQEDLGRSARYLCYPCENVNGKQSFINVHYLLE